MDTRQLESLLGELREELNRVPPTSPNRAPVERLARDLEAVIATREGDPRRLMTLRERLGEALREFEASHPRLATATENVIDALVRLNL